MCWAISAIRQPSRICRRHARCCSTPSSPRVPSLPRTSMQPTNRVGDMEGCRRHADGSVDDAEGLQGRLRPAIATAAGWGWPHRPSPAARACPTPCTPPSREYMSSANMALMMYPGLTQGAIAAILAHGTDEQKATFLPKLVDGRLDRHHEPDRAALRHRPRPAAHQGGAARRRHLQDLRPEDLHLGRRARPRRQHRPSGAGPHRGRAGRASRASRCSSCRSSCSTPTAIRASATRVSCGSIEEKMGIHGNATCVMNYDEAEGYAARRGEWRA